MTLTRACKFRALAVLSCSACAHAQSGAADIADVLAPLGGPQRPGCIAGVYRDGLLVDSAASGAADLDRRMPLTPRTVFNIGSVSKQFTAFAVLLLEQRGALSRDDSVTKYVPELGEPARPVTLRQLLHHLGGLRDYVGLLRLAGRSYAERTTREQALDVLARQRGVNAPAGAAYEYSNTGYFLLGVTVERVSGRSLREFMRDEVFAPLGMTSTTIVDRYPADIPALARGYSKSDDGFEIDESAWEQTGDGQVHTTLEDLARWEQNFLTRKLGAEALRKMIEPGRLVSGQHIDYGAGVSLWKHRSLPTVSHAGDWAGYSAHYLRFPEQRYAVAALCNRSDVRPAEYTAAIAERHLAKLMQGEVEPRGLALLREGGGGAHPSKMPAGLYRNGETGAYVRLSLDAGGPRLHAAGAASPLQEAAPGVFHALELGRTYAVFTPDGGAQPAHITLQDSPQRYVYELVPGWTPARLDIYQGAFASLETQARLEVVLRDGGLVLRTGAAEIKLRQMAAGEFEGEGLIDEGAPFTLRFTQHAAPDFLLFSDGLRGLKFARAQ